MHSNTEKEGQFYSENNLIWLKIMVESCVCLGSKEIRDLVLKKGLDELKLKFLCFQGIHNSLPSFRATLGYSQIRIDLLSLHVLYSLQFKNWHASSKGWTDATPFSAFIIFRYTFCWARETFSCKKLSALTFQCWTNETRHFLDTFRRKTFWKKTFSAWYTFNLESISVVRHFLILTLSSEIPIRTKSCINQV